MKTVYPIQKKIIAHVMLLVFLVMSLAAIRPQKVYAYEETIFKYTVKVKKNYLALRKAKAFKAENEIGKLYSGDTVIHCPTDSENETYWYVYSPKHKKLGYVNRNYLKFDEEYTGKVHYTAKVKKGYLALRSAKKYEAKNEKGKMYTGDEVIVLYKDSKTDYWTVYSPDLEKAGYTNKNYLKYDPNYDYDEDDDDEDEDETYEDDEDYQNPEGGHYQDIDYGADAYEGYDYDYETPEYCSRDHSDNENYTTMTQTDTLVFSRAPRE